MLYNVLSCNFFLFTYNILLQFLLSMAQNVTVI